MRVSRKNREDFELAHLRRSAPESKLHHPGSCVASIYRHVIDRQDLPRQKIRL